MTFAPDFHALARLIMLAWRRQASRGASAPACSNAPPSNSLRGCCKDTITEFIAHLFTPCETALILSNRNSSFWLCARRRNGAESCIRQRSWSCSSDPERSAFTVTRRAARKEESEAAEMPIVKVREDMVDMVLILGGIWVSETMLVGLIVPVSRVTCQRSESPIFYEL